LAYWSSSTSPLRRTSSLA
jgi:hypothetical protein